MTRVRIIRVEPEHYQNLRDNIRDADRSEVEAATGLSCEQVIDRLALNPGDKWAAFAGGDMVCVFGVEIASALTGMGVPWLLSTRAIEKHQVSFLRYSKPMLAKLLYRVENLVNFVDDRNILAKRWLRWLGFTLHDPIPYGPKLMPFRCFTMEVKDV